MNRHRAYWPLDEAPVPDGDGRFLGVNARLDPAQLGDGELASAVNCRFDEGRISTRRGLRIMAWGAKNHLGGAPELILPYGPVRRAGAFNDPMTGLEWAIVVRDGDDDVPLGATYRARPGNTGVIIPAPDGTDFTTVTDLIQTYNGMIALRGPDLAPLYLANLDEGWRSLPSAPSGKEAIPVSTQGLYFGNRLFVVDARTSAQYLDSVWVSDFGGVTSVLQGEEYSVFQSFKINQGSADRLVGIAKFNDQTLVAAKAGSIHVVSNIYGTNEQLAQNARLDQLTSEYGCLAPRSFVQVGRDLWFLGHRRGVCSIQQTTTNALQGVDIPVSRDIQPLVDRINWECAQEATAASHGNRVYFAVPLDGSTENNAVLVYSTLTGKWAGYDQSDATRVRDWMRFKYAGAVRLGFLSIDGFVYLYEDGFRDDLGDAAGHIESVPIAATALTRGYGGRVSGVKRFTRMEARIQTWDTSMTVTAVPDGRGEIAEVLAVDVVGTRYRRPHGRAPWVADNEDGDWDERHREDYAVNMSGPAHAGVQVTSPGGEGTMAFGILQSADLSRRMRARGSSMQLEFVATRGRLEVSGVSVDTLRGRTRDAVVT